MSLAHLSSTASRDTMADNLTLIYACLFAVFLKLLNSFDFSSYFLLNLLVRARCKIFELVHKYFKFLKYVTTKSKVWEKIILKNTLL